MANNPAAAFLQGYAFVDAMESNKQDRKFKAEQQSWLRKAWDRRDEAYNKRKLDTYRAEKAYEFSLISDEIMQEQGDEIERLKADGSAESLERVKQIRADWFDGDEESQARLINEGWKRQLQRDPGIGKLFGYVNGVYPEDGPLVLDTNNPVSAMVVAPPSSPFRGRLYMEIRGINGPQAMTEGRGAGAKDKAWSTPATLSSLYAMYGSPELIKQYQVFGVIMDGLGANEATGTTESVDTAKRTPSGDTVTEPTPESTAEADAIFEATQQAEADAQQQALVGNNQMDRAALELEADMRDKTPDSVFARGAAEYDERTAGEDKGGYGPGPYISTEDLFPRTRAASERAADRTVELLGEGSRAANIMAKDDITNTEAGAVTQDVLRAGAGTVASVTGAAAVDTAVGAATVAGAVVKPGIDFAAGLFGPGPDGNTTAETGPDKPGDIVDANKQDPNLPSLAESTANSDTPQGVVDKTPAPANDQAAANIGNALMASQGQGRPPPEDVYKAYMMARAGILTLPEVDYYKRTGQLGKAAEVKFASMGDGKGIFYDAQGQYNVVDTTGGGGGDATVQDQTALQNHMNKVLQGIEDPAERQELIDAVQGAATLYGIPSNNKGGLNIRANPDIMNELREGASLVAKFEENKIQGLIDGFLAGSGGSLFDVKPGDFYLPVNATSVMIGTVLAKNGVYDDRKATVAFKDYFQSFAGARGVRAMGEGWLKDRVELIEAGIDDARYEAKRSKDGTFAVTDDDGTVMFTAKKGMDRHELREEYIEYIVKSLARLQ